MAAVPAAAFPDGGLPEGVVSTPQGVAVIHPWQGKMVGVIGDSISDPRHGKGKIKKYWEFLAEWLGITPKVTAVSGRQWNDVPRQAQKLHDTCSDSIDALLVFLGTNDFNAAVPVGVWYDETPDSVMAAVHAPRSMQARMHRTPVMSDSTLCGRINIGLSTLKRLYPDKQIVLLTPLHRAFADFSTNNLQPDESYQNACGEWFDAYVEAVCQAGRVWGVPVVDLNAMSGLNPMVEEQLVYFNNPATDRLHPSTAGQRRMARTLMQQLLTLPVEM